MSSSENNIPEEVNDWIITEQIFKESGLSLDEDTAQHNDFLRNLNAAGKYLNSLSAPVVQFAQVTDSQMLFAFDETEPVDLMAPFFPVDDERQLWALHHQDAEGLESPVLDTPQISALTAYGYNRADKLMLFNLQEQRLLSINANPVFAQAMVRALAVEHAMEPWNASRTIYLVGFGAFAEALKHNLDPYHSNVIAVDSLNDLARDSRTLEGSTIFSIGQDAAIVSEFVRTTKEFSLGMVADVPIGGGFIYFQETEDRGALEPGNLTIFPFLMSEDTDDYKAVEANYAKHLESQGAGEEELAEVPSQPVEEILDESNFVLTDEDLQALLASPASSESQEPLEEGNIDTGETVHNLETEPAVDEEGTARLDSSTHPQESSVPTGYLKLMGPAPELVGANAVITGFPAEIIAYTYLQQHYGEDPPTFADMCMRLWGTTPTGSEKSKLSARRKRAKEKLHEVIPEAELITERSAWKVNNITTDIDLIPQIPASQPLTETPWASSYLPGLTKKISEAPEPTE